MTLNFFVPGRLQNPLNGSLSRAHWTRKRVWAETWKAETLLAIITAQPRRWTPAQIALPNVVTFRAHVGKLWDDDNVPAGLKPVRDALIGRIIDSDAPDSGHRFVYSQVVDRERRGVEVTVETHRPPGE